MTIEAILALIRHGLTTGGGILVAQGMASSEEIATVAGAIVTFLGFGWSLVRKIQNKPRIGTPTDARVAPGGDYDRWSGA